MAGGISRLLALFFLIGRRRFVHLIFLRSHPRRDSTATKGRPPDGCTEKVSKSGAKGDGRKDKCKVCFFPN